MEENAFIMEMIAGFVYLVVRVNPSANPGYWPQTIGGVAPALWSGLEVVFVAQDHIYLREGDWSTALGIVNGLLEMVPIALVWLVFYPPAAYRRRIERAPHRAR